MNTESIPARLPRRKMFSVSDTAGNYHCFDPRLVSTITTYKVTNSSEWRCEVHIGQDDTDTQAKKQLFLLRFGTQEEVVELAKKIEVAREDAWRVHYLELIPPLTILGDTHLDVTKIVYLRLNRYEGGGGLLRFTIIVTLRFTPSFAKELHIDAGNEEQANAWYQQILRDRDAAIDEGMEVSFLEHEPSISEQFMSILTKQPQSIKNFPLKS